VRVGFVGVGNMGGAMAANAIAAGHDVAVCDAREEALEVLVALGARAAATPSDAAAGAEIVSVVVMDGAQVERVTAGADGVFAGVAPGAVVAIHSTVHPRSVRAAADGAPGDVAVLDAPISGGVQGARAATLCIMVGGDADAFARARPVFEAMGNLVLHVGPLGAGLGAKLARNLVGYVTLVGAAEGNALGVAAGVDADVLYRIEEHTGTLSPMMQSLMRVPGGDDVYSADIQPLIDLSEKDLDVTLEYAADLGLDLPATRLTRDQIADALRTLA
jgi:3-hydroxyisobutyrate dehydrogenase-like beta-hydroxyacid dehydrogenase